MTTPDDSTIMPAPRTPQCKRKTSTDTSPGEVPLIKRHNSMSDISSVSCTSGISGQEPKKGIPFTDMVTQALKQKSVLEELASFLPDLLAPVIKSTMDTAIALLQDSVINPLLDANKELVETVKSQKVTITSQNKQITDQKAQIKSVEKQLDSTVVKCQSLEADLNDLQQYGRRNSLRLNNFPTKGTPSEFELTDQVCHFINSSVFKLDMLHVGDISETGCHIRPDDIERCHPIGPQNSKQVLVKFCRYHTKTRVLKQRRNLKNNPDRVFIVEDLTRFNHEIVLDLMHAKTHNRLHSFWTSDGKILVKLSESDRPRQVKTREAVAALVC